MINNLIASLNDLPAVSMNTVKDYERESQRLVNHVNNELEAYPRILDLIGGNPIGLMQNNHRNHAAFMITVFKIGSYELLARTVPWVYRAYHARGFSYDYFPVELAAWKHAVERCLGDNSNEVAIC